jgi:hypothetical protein
MKLVTLERLQQEARKRRLTLCPTCAEHYEPCLVVIFYRIANVVHIMPGAYEFGYRPVFTQNDFFLKASIRRRLLYTACEELVRSLEEVNYKVIGQICGLSLRSHDQLDSFICYILQKYPGYDRAHPARGWMPPGSRMGHVATRPNERVIALFVKVEYLKKEVPCSSLSLRTRRAGACS